MNVFSALDAKITGHNAWSNEFFEGVKSGLSSEQLRMVCPEYLYFTQAFPGILAHLAARVDPGVQFHLVSILYSELGSGVESNAHSNLFRRLCLDVGLTSQDLMTGQRLKTTEALVLGLKSLYGEAQLLQSIGAQYALECQADNMLRSFRPAFASLDSQDPKGRSEGVEFFEVHESEEPEHISAMRHALMRNAHTEEHFALVFSGARSCLNLFSDFWNGLSKQLKSHTNGAPRSGLTPRSS